jgi:hypothetical protein
VSNIENPDAGKQPQQDRKVQPIQQPPKDRDEDMNKGMPGRKGNLDQQDERGTPGKPRPKDMKKDGELEDQDDAELDDEDTPPTGN